MTAAPPFSSRTESALSMSAAVGGSNRAEGTGAARIPLVVRGRVKMLLEPALPPLPAAATGPERVEAAGIGAAGAAPGGGGGRAPTSDLIPTGRGGGPPGFAGWSSTANAPDGRRTAIPAPALAIDPGATPACCSRIFSSRMVSRVVWLSVVSRSKRTPMPGVTPAREASCSRIQTTVPSPWNSGTVSTSWKSSLRRVPTGSGSRVRMKIPPRLTSTP